MLSGIHLRAFPTCSWLFTWIFYGLVPGVCSLNPSSMLWQTSNSSKGLGPCCYCNPNGCTSLSGSVLRRGPGSTKARSSDEGGGWGRAGGVCVCVCQRLYFCNFSSITPPRFLLSTTRCYKNSFGKIRRRYFYLNRSSWCTKLHRGARSPLRPLWNAVKTSSRLGKPVHVHIQVLNKSL